MARIERSPRAKADVLTAACYIAEQSQSRMRAKRWIDSIDEQLKLLVRHTHAGEARPDLGANIRSFPVGKYIIFYRPLDDGVQVVRVLHSSRDIPRIFRTGEN
ncbi:MAG: type II toxin-antitoxin system RelE/ParE family toxin [Pirellulaceae bacterium]|jgi:toxin ParE1/3/4|nr:type II toxin-antitoxin system RelE/ParE family toxin [Pirellulaceae bacterium]MDP7014767.1 type II toxin-antitoxin system RelE/ParE family toxin [Pirellulaceae bacterium]